MTPAERQAVSVEDSNPIGAEHYGSKTLAVEPGGIEQIPDSERHGSPVNLLWTWMSPNLEFATVAVGIIGPLFFGLSFGQTLAAIILGTVLGSVTHGVLSSWGPQHGLAQMVLSRTGFGFLGNILPAGLNALVAGIGWFAVNSISGALALHALVGGLPTWLCLVVVVAAQLLIAFLGHNLVHAFERYALPLLAVVFALGLYFVFSKADLGAAGKPVPGAFLIQTAAAFGYACGWNPYASDYTRYLPKTSKARTVGLFAALGISISCIVLEAAGAAMVSAAGKAAAVDPGVYTGLMPTWLGDLTLLCIALGAVAANALNIYSGAMSFLALGISLPPHRARAIVAVVFGLLGLVLALFGLQNAGTNYENFLLVIAYWIGPWLGVVLTDRLLRRGDPRAEVSAIATDRRYVNWAGAIAMFVAMVVSIWLFSNQTLYAGVIVKASPGIGDITFLVGFVLAAGLYAVLRRLLPARTSVGVTA
ncbi:cytosine permease [Terrabacter aerolatus]|uniref:Cytosine permease n=1 Tax=Terrabacter aerolatus TaxID=422442 RepID=A0A512CWR2_9MICO|nr:cytosine permease [Terrabacter aerolatus]GEO28654.1 cytosine permease [Terrabacter aerolatus]